MFGHRALGTLSWARYGVRMKKSRCYSAHYISGTHWDREWYRPFQEFRFLLVGLIDGLLDLMERDAAFRYFHFDGQTCMLDDYIRIRPEQRPRLEALIRGGRILIGPWYTMPDLFCVGDEALIRNLLLGRRVAREWGAEPMPVGFVCDMFGHPSQLPQIFAGFGYRDCMLGRGTNEHTTPPFFTWQAPDGSAVFTFKLQDSQGYGAFALPRATLERPTFVLSTMNEFTSELAAAGDDPERQRAVREKHFRLQLAGYVSHEVKRANGDTLCLMDSMDHIPPATEVARYLRLIREACPDVVPTHSNLPAFFAEARRTARRVPVRHGELREPSRDKCGYLWLIPNCVSARVGIKLANDGCQHLLEKWVEPLMAIANREGAGIPNAFLLEAWRQLVSNHAHDSICGCSIDQVHRDMRYRFDQARVLGEQLRTQALAHLTAGAPELGKGKNDFTLVLFNPLPWRRDEVVAFDVDLPPDYPADFADGFFTQRLKAFTLETADGQAIPYQRLAFIPKTNERSRLAQFCFQSDGQFTRYRIAAKVALPACGYMALRVKPSPAPVRTVGTLRTGPASAANEWLAIEIGCNGTLTLTDRKSGEVYPGLLLFESRSEVGDGWFHGHSLNDEQSVSTASSAEVSVLHEGPEWVSFKVRVTLRVPARYDNDAERPVDTRVPVVAESVITLRRGGKAVEVEATLDNSAEDHRMRVLFPTGCAAAKTYFAHHPFDFVERAIKLDETTSSWQEMDQAEKPFLSIQAVGAGRRGLAFLSAGGLHEGGVRDDGERTMQVTLFRSFRKTITTGGEVDGLERGPVTVRFALMPYGGQLPRKPLLDELARFQTGVLTRQTGLRPSGFPPLPPRGVAEKGFVELAEGGLVVSAIKPAEEGDDLVIRLWNPTAARQGRVIRFWRRVKRALYADLSEQPAGTSRQPRIEGKTVSVSAGPHQVVTVRIELG